MKFLRQMDLYKGVILASLLLLPVVGWWIRNLGTQIAATERAIADATKTGGWIEKVGKLLGDIALVDQNRTIMTNATSDPKVYFQGQIFASVTTGLDSSLFTFKPSSEERRIGQGDKQQVVDYYMKIDFPKQGGKDYEMNRATLQAILFNCESGAKGQNVQAQSIWKLLALSIQNAGVQAVLSSKKTPPPDLEDRWIVKNLDFVRREPKKEAKK
jgi:hypothetical protein